VTLAGRDLTIGYSDRVVGRGLNVALAQGEVLALLGPTAAARPRCSNAARLLAPLAGEAAIEAARW